MRICVVAPPGECLQVKQIWLFAGNTVRSIYERVRGVSENALYTNRRYFYIYLYIYSYLLTYLIVKSSNYPKVVYEVVIYLV